MSVKTIPIFLECISNDLTGKYLGDIVISSADNMEKNTFSHCNSHSLKNYYIF